jgi:peroxin-4
MAPFSSDNITGGSRNAGPMKRLMTELQKYHTDPNDALLELGLADSDIMHLHLLLVQLSNVITGGRWLLDIHIPHAYPNAPPSIRFVTPICHPNVDFKTGEICLDLLKTSWSPVYTISTTMTSIQQLLTSAEPDSPLNVDVAQLFRLGDDVGAQSLIRFYTETEKFEGRRR